jgi:hypothetical protein
MLMPALALARKQAQEIKCLSNVRQIAIALTEYAGDYHFRYPPNFTSPPPGQFWCDADRIGRYAALPRGGLTSDGIFICPNDDNSMQSYSMNFWASSKIDVFYSQTVQTSLWNPTASNSSELMLVVEGWSYLGSSSTGGFTAPQTVGYRGASEGQRFGALGGVVPYKAGRFGVVNCELPYMRHRAGIGGVYTGTQPHGRVSVAFGDEHAEIVSDSVLANATTGLSSGHCVWYEGDSR